MTRKEIVDAISALGIKAGDAKEYYIAAALMHLAGEILEEKEHEVARVLGMRFEMRQQQRENER